MSQKVETSIRCDHNQNPAVCKVTKINYNEKTAKKKRRASWFSRYFGQTIFPDILSQRGLGLEGSGLKNAGLQDGRFGALELQHATLEFYLARIRLSGKCGVQSAECGKRGMWKRWSVENAERGKCGV